MVRYLTLALVLLTSSSRAEDDLTQRRAVVQKVLDASVLVESHEAYGSGVAIRRGGQLFVVTNWHVVRRNRKVEDGKVKFTDVKVVKFGVFDGRTAARWDCGAEVVAFSDNEDGYDLAVLRVRDPKFVEAGVEFYAGAEIPYIGMPLYHVGCFYGLEGPGSFVTGVMSQHGRIVNDHVFDQVSTTNFSGSSGGGVFDTEGRCIGLLTRRSGETFGYVNPVREIRAWAKDNGTEWVLDPDRPVPDRDKLIAARDSCKLPDEGTPVSPATDKDMEKSLDDLFKTLLDLKIPVK